MKVGLLREWLALEKYLSLRNIGRYHPCLRDEQVLQSLYSLFVSKPVSACGDHDGVDNDVPYAVLPQTTGYGSDCLRRLQHAYLHGFGSDVVDHCLYLRCNNVGGYGVNGSDTDGVLYRHGGYCRCRIAS